MIDIKKDIIENFKNTFCRGARVNSNGEIEFFNLTTVRDDCSIKEYEEFILESLDLFAAFVLAEEKSKSN